MDARVAAFPEWTRAVDRALVAAARHIRLIRAATPINVPEELARLHAAWDQGEPARPAFRYEVPTIDADLLHALDRVGDFTASQGALGELYAARIRELQLEAAMIAAIGTPRLLPLAARRFGPGAETDCDHDDFRRARRHAAEWAGGPAPDDVVALIPTDDRRDPRSLVSRMEVEIGRRRLAVRVVVQEGLASLAATGDGVVLVAARQMASVVDVERTVLHEMEGHVLPRDAAERSGITLLAVGTARGVDDQEGRALLIERDAGFFDAARRRELSLRHLAAEATLAGADFVETARAVASRGASPVTAVRIASRVQRGGGIARELVYLPAMLRVERALSADASVGPLMASGRVSTTAASTLATLLGNVGDPYGEMTAARQRAAG